MLALLGDKKDQNESSTLKKHVTEKTQKEATKEEIFSSSNNEESNKL